MLKPSSLPRGPKPAAGRATWTWQPDPHHHAVDLWPDPISIVSLQVSLIWLCELVEAKPRLWSSHRTGRTPRRAMLMIRTRDVVFLLVKCNEEVVREPYTGTEECEYHVGEMMHRWSMAIGIKPAYECCRAARKYPIRPPGSDRRQLDRTQRCVLATGTRCRSSTLGTCRGNWTMHVLRTRMPGQPRARSHLPARRRA